LITKKVVSIFILVSFLFTGQIGSICQARADASTAFASDNFHLPPPGALVRLSPEFNPPILKGLKVHPDNPFRLDFILDKGDRQQEQLEQESTKLIKYFLAGITIPKKDLWVNLSPYEKNRIIPELFGQTQMGRDLLAEDYMLKQITASLIYPEDEIGKRFWKRVYEEAVKKFGTTNIPLNTFNKVWIVPEKAVVYENAKAGTAYVVESKLKVLLEQDYLSMQKHNAALPLTSRNDTASVGANVMRDIVIPELTKEVNENQNFAQLRQVYNSLILATWYKKKIKDSILGKAYADKNKVAGIMSSPNTLIGDPEHIYQQYLQAFKKGVYNYIKEERLPQPIVRRYFSGGVNFDSDSAMKIEDHFYTTRLHDENLVLVGAQLEIRGRDMAMKVDEGAYKAIYDKALEILKGVPDGQELEIDQLRARLNQESGPAKVSMHMLKAALSYYKPINDYEKLKINTQDRKAVKIRREKELEIVNELSQGDQLTVGQLTNRLNQVVGGEDVPVMTVENDIARDRRFDESQVKEKLNMKKRSGGDLKAVKVRRDKKLEILYGKVFLKKHFILLEDSNAVSSKKLKDVLENKGYSVGIAYGNTQIKNYLKYHSGVDLLVFGKEISKAILGERKFLSISSFLNQDEEMDLDGERRFLNAVTALLPLDSTDHSSDKAMIMQGNPSEDMKSALKKLYSEYPPQYAMNLWQYIEFLPKRIKNEFRVDLERETLQQTKEVLKALLDEIGIKFPQGIAAKERLKDYLNLILRTGHVYGLLSGVIDRLYQIIDEMMPPLPEGITVLPFGVSITKFSKIVESDPHIRSTLEENYQIILNSYFEGLQKERDYGHHQDAAMINRDSVESIMYYRDFSLGQEDWNDEHLREQYVAIADWISNSRYGNLKMNVRRYEIGIYNRQYKSDRNKNGILYSRLWTVRHEMSSAVHAYLIAHAMGLGNDDILKIVFAAAIHDIGKTNIDYRILNYPGKLDESKMQKIRQQPQKRILFAHLAD